MSVFATVTTGEQPEKNHPFGGLDEKKVEKELTKMATDAEKTGDENPRAAAQLMREFSETKGMKMGKDFY